MTTSSLHVSCKDSLTFETYFRQVGQVRTDRRNSWNTSKVNSIWTFPKETPEFLLLFNFNTWGTKVVILYAWWKKSTLWPGPIVAWCRQPKQNALGGRCPVLTLSPIIFPTSVRQIWLRILTWCVGCSQAVIHMPPLLHDDLYWMQVHWDFTAHWADLSRKAWECNKCILGRYIARLAHFLKNLNWYAPPGHTVTKSELVHAM